MLPESDIWKINGRAIYSPSAASVTMEDLEVSAERTADGVLHRVRARQGARKVSFRYDAMTQEEIGAVLALLEPEFFDLTYLDPMGVRTINCYCAKKDGEMYSAVFYHGLWRNVTFNCVER